MERPPRPEWQGLFREAHNDEGFDVDRDHSIMDVAWGFLAVEGAARDDAPA